MSKKLQKSLRDYLSKIKKQTPHLQFSHSSLSSATSKILSGYRCKHTKTLSSSDVCKGRRNHHDHRHHHSEVGEGEAAATMEDIENFCNENFKTWYNDGINDTEPTHEEYKAKYDATTLRDCGILDGSPRLLFTPPRDLGRSCFFVSSSSWSSLTEETGTGGTRTTSDSEDKDADGTSAIPGGIEGCVALLTVSPSPYADFRRSMHEMLVARSSNQRRLDWDFMEKLLFSYLRLNEKKQYRYILSAFADLVADLRQDSSNCP